MRHVWRLLFIAILFSPMAMADSEETEMRAFKNFDRRIQALENYSVTFKEHGKPDVVIKAAKQSTDDQMLVQLLPKSKRYIAAK